jgi:hypothetical protein
MSAPRRATIYLDPELHRALRVKAAETDQSISDLVKEPNLDFESVLKDLRRRGKL